jgi:ComF family protein
VGKAQAFRPLLSAGLAACDGLVAALLSPPCVACGAVLPRIACGALCDACWGTVQFITAPLCGRCGDPASSSGADACGCGQLPPHVSMARALGPDEGTLRTAIHALKYEGRRSIAGRLAALLLEHCGTVLSGADAVVPVPLHWRRQWSRGFNQADEIARHLRLPVVRALRRARHTPSQAGLGADRRSTNLRGAFVPRRAGRRSSVRGRRVLLLDDVSTTGATVAACAAVLKEMGASEIGALTVARTLRSAARGDLAA